MVYQTIPTVKAQRSVSYNVESSIVDFTLKVNWFKLLCSYCTVYFESTEFDVSLFSHFCDDLFIGLHFKKRFLICLK